MSDVPGGPTPPPPPPPPGTPPGPGGFRPRTLGEILSEAFRIYRENAAKLMVIVAVVVVPLSFIGALLGHFVGEPTLHRVKILGQPATIEYSRSFGVTILALLIAAAIGVIIWAILQAAILRGAAQATIGDPVDVEASYRWGLSRFGSVLLVALLVGIVVGVGFILLIIPGLINGHTHIPMTLFRGLADDLDLQEWLTKYIFPAEAKNVTEEFVRYRYRQEIAGIATGALPEQRLAFLNMTQVDIFSDNTVNILADNGLLLAQLVFGSRQDAELFADLVTSFRARRAQARGR